MNKIFCQIAHSITRERSIIGTRIEVANKFWPRLCGLLGRKHLETGQGLLLSACSSIHCMGMRFAIDAVFMDRSFRVVDIRANLQPGSVASHRHAHYVLELKAGEAQRNGIEIGELLSITYC
jgi:uncharacterized membrane protein (UPF0127 family)